jgi:hypothetical protein
MTRLAVFFFCIFTFFSCAQEKRAQFPLYGTDAFLSAKGKAAQEGRLDFSRPKKLEYRFESLAAIPPNSSLQIRYDFNFIPPDEVKDKFIIVVNTGAASWELPADFESASYAIPVDDTFSGRFSVALERSPAAGKEKIAKDAAPVLLIRSIGFTERFYGFYQEAESPFSLHKVYYLSPFVSIDNDKKNYLIDVPYSYWSNKYAGIQASYESNAVINFAGKRIESVSGNKSISVSPAFFSEEGKASISAEGLTSFVLRSTHEPLAFPQPINADPGIVISWDKSVWRNSDYEVFRWDAFPSIIIFDFADYDIQDRMLKRLAFFVEKTGFRGRLAPDSEIEELHAWNAHDYRAEDLARFFEAARAVNFPLLDEELQLKQILLNEKIIKETQGGITAGEGAIVSISRESAEYLRFQFMAHEGYHGIFFLDEDFREFTRQRWAGLSAPAKRFIISYFEFQQYDVRDEFLLVNEFMGHILQQAVSNASRYFGQMLPSRLETNSTWRATHLPQKDEVAGNWPILAEAFTEEARAFSAYVNQRWGLSAGRVWGVRVR